MVGENTTKIRYETMTPKTALILCASALGFLITNLIIGAVANIPLHRKKCIETWHCKNEYQHEFDPRVCSGLDMRKPNSTWLGDLTDLSTLHQYVYLEMIANNRAPFGINTLVEIQVTLEGAGDVLHGFGTAPSGSSERTMILDKAKHTRRIRCPNPGLRQWTHWWNDPSATRDPCDPTIIFHHAFIHFSEYHIRVTLNPSADPKTYKLHHEAANEVCYGDIDNPLDWMGNTRFCLVMLNPEITNLELSMRYIYVFFTTITLLWYGRQLKQLPPNERSYEQKWVGVLLVAVLGLDDPFFACDIASPGFFWSFLNNVFMGTFFALLLLWWLIIFDGILKSVSNITRQGTQSQRFLEFYVPKITLVCSIWLVSIIVFTYVRLHEYDDPSYNKFEDYEGYSPAKWLLLFLFCLAFLWLFFLVARALGELRMMAFRFKFMFLLTLFMAVCSFAGFMIGALGPIPESALEFIGFFSLFNTYVWVLAFCFSPDPEGAKDARRDLDTHEGALDGEVTQRKSSHGTTV